MHSVAHAFPTNDMIRSTFELMLREWGHRGTAMRFTCRDLGLPTEAVLEAVGARASDPAEPRPH
jgi:hypothetical protein